MKSTDLTLRFHTADADLRPRLLAAVADLGERFERPFLTVRLDGTVLPDDAVQALVAALRRLREFGGALAAVPETVELAAAFRLMGLDRVFAFPIEPPRSPRRFGRAFRAAAAAVLAAVAVAAAPVGAQAPESLDPGQILSRVVERNPNLNTFQGRVHIDVRMTTFPFFRQHLDGTTYYKRPNNYEVVFDHVPGYAKGFDRLFADVGDPSDWGRRFVVTSEGEKNLGEKREIALRMVQRVRGMIDHENVYVDPSTWTIDRIEYVYYNGGHVTMNQTFREVGGHSLLVAQDADITIAHFGHAKASGTYDDYRTNVAVDDGVFKKGEKQ